MTLEELLERLKKMRDQEVKMKDEIEIKVIKKEDKKDEDKVDNTDN